MLIFRSISVVIRMSGAALVFLAVLSMPSLAQNLSQSVTAKVVAKDALEDPFDLHDLEADQDKTATFSPAEASSGGALDSSLSDLEALKYAADKGDEVAMWRLGRHYADDSVSEVDHLKAYKMFRKMVETMKDHSPFSPRAPYIANALNRLGIYYRDGIEGSDIHQDRSIAWKMFYTAGNFYRDPDALYSLSELCDDPDQMQFHCSRRQGVRWLNLAAEHGHVGAQARLGYRMFEGEGMKRKPIKGLMWLTVARKRADITRDGWVNALHESAFSVATTKQREEAVELADKWLKKHCGDDEDDNVC